MTSSPSSCVSPTGTPVRRKAGAAFSLRSVGRSVSHRVSLSGLPQRQACRIVLAFHRLQMAEGLRQSVFPSSHGLQPRLEWVQP